MTIFNLKIITWRQFVRDVGKGRGTLGARGGDALGGGGDAHGGASPSLAGPAVAVHRVELQGTLEGRAGHVAGENVIYPGAIDGERETHTHTTTALKGGLLYLTQHSGDGGCVCVCVSLWAESLFCSREFAGSGGASSGRGFSRVFFSDATRDFRGDSHQNKHALLGGNMATERRDCDVGAATFSESRGGGWLITVFGGAVGEFFFYFSKFWKRVLNETLFLISCVDRYFEVRKFNKCITKSVKITCFLFYVRTCVQIFFILFL